MIKLQTFLINKMYNKVSALYIILITKWSALRKQNNV